MIYLITINNTKRAYYSFSRLVKEEGLEDICKRYQEKVPTKNDLPVTLIFNKIKIEKVDVDERV